MGCEFELRQLAQRLRPGQVVLIVDASTDRALLERTVSLGVAGMQMIELKHAADAGAAFEALLRAAG